LYVSTVDIIIAWQGKSSHENNYIFNNWLLQKKIQDELDESTSSNITLKASLDEAQQARQRMEVRRLLE
jgi:hypothetical protein